jgi:hypothetical protein
MDIGKIVVGSQKSKNLQELFSTNKLGMMACICYSSYIGGINRRIMVQTGMGKKETLYEK